MGAKLGGGGGGKYTIQQNSDINVTPFVDVMLVLLIIFMVSIPTATVSIKLDLPPAQPSSSNKKPPFINVMGHDEIFIGATKTSIDTLPGDFAAALKANDPSITNVLDQEVMIRGDKDINYDDFMRVLNVMQQNGYLKIGLINEDLE